MIRFAETRDRAKPRLRARDALRDFHPRGEWPFWTMRCICRKSGPRGMRCVFRARSPVGAGDFAIKVLARARDAQSDFDAMMAAHAFAPDLNVRPLHLDLERRAIITPYFPGGTIGRQINSDTHDEMVMAAARWLRRFHCLSPFNQTGAFGADNPADWLARNRPGRRKLRHYPRLQAALARRDAALAGAPCQIVIGHNDFKAANLVRTDGGVLSIDRSRNSKTLVETEIARFLFLLRQRYAADGMDMDEADKRSARDREIFLDFYALPADRQAHLDLALDRAAAHAWLSRDIARQPQAQLAVLNRDIARISEAA